MKVIVKETQTIFNDLLIDTNKIKKVLLFLQNKRILFASRNIGTQFITYAYDLLGATIVGQAMSTERIDVLICK